MSFGAFFFAAPLALLGLLVLPVLWWLLRATPPRPAFQELPSLRLLDGIDETDTTPARTPWYILALRLGAAALAILGLASPLWSPQSNPDTDAEAPALVLLVIDDGWTSAGRWSDTQADAATTLRDLRRDTGVHLLTTAPAESAPDPAQRLSREDALSVVRSLSPQPFAPDPASALARLIQAGIAPDRTLWISDGLAHPGQADLAGAFAALGPLAVLVNAPRGVFAITGVSAQANGARVSVVRLPGPDPLDVTLTARTLDGAPVSTAQGRFEAGEARTEVAFDLPTAVVNRIGILALSGLESAGAVWLWDSTAKRRRVGLVSPGSLAQPLLEDVYYVRKALEPFAEVTEGGLAELVQFDPDAIILTDTGPLDAADAAALTTWVEGGGALIRFAGPRLAGAGTPELLPVPLRRSSRAFGGALNWEQPQRFGDWPAASPFAGLPLPERASVRQQVLAEPAMDLEQFTWARLTDGSPVVTASPRGDGTVVLFHVTAGPEWSDLALTGTFVELLRRAIAAGRGRPVVAGEDGVYTPLRTLNGRGRLGLPDASAQPLAGELFFAERLSPAHPPGLYEGPAGVRARNASPAEPPGAVTSWPAGAQLLGDLSGLSKPLAGPLLTLALALVIIDLALALFLAGRLRGLVRGWSAPRGAARAGVASGFALAAGAWLVFGLPEAAAQDVVTRSSSKFEEAAREFRLAYVETGDTALDATSRAGLLGLSVSLYRRTSVEPAEPHGVDLETDVLDVYPLLYFAVPEGGTPLSARAVSRLNAWLGSGGVLVIDSRLGGRPNTDGTRPLEGLLPGLDTPGLIPLPEDHVLRRSFFILDDLPGRYAGGRTWIERAGEGQTSRIILTGADWAAAWAVDARGRPLNATDGGEDQREMALRTGINVVIYALTGTYKDDQVHIPELLERLGDDRSRLPVRILDGGDESGPQ